MSRTAPGPWHGEPADVRPVVVGVHPGQRPRVLAAAAELAADLGAPLLCVWADPSRIPVAVEPDGTLVSTPLDPDAVDDDGGPAGVDELTAQLETRLPADGPPAWRFLPAAGEPARALAAVAAREDGALLVIGARRPGVSGWMGRLVGGSVAGALAHTQARPVVVVPVLEPGDA